MSLTVGTLDSLFTFATDFLRILADQNRRAYATADPFPHVVLDNFLPEGVLDPVLDEFPGDVQIDWTTFDRSSESLKRITKDETQLGSYTRYLIEQFHSWTFTRFLERLTGIQGIIPDPHLLGGGLHRVERGGFLKIHADFNRHPALRLDRRVNLLLYLNKNWKEEYGGNLELWDQGMTRCAQKILPVFNRCVIFSTTSTSYHGNPEPLQCPSTEARKALTLYYYTNGRPEEERRESHSTLFLERPGEVFTETVRQWIRAWTPPVLLQTAAAFRRKVKGRRSPR